MEKKLESQSNIATDTHLTCLDLLCLFFTDVCLHQKCFLWLFSLSSFPFDPLSVFAVFRFLSCCFFIHWFTDFSLSLSLSLFLFSLLLSLSLSLFHTHLSHWRSSTPWTLIVPPKWKIEPSDQSAVIGDRVTFDCAASGHPHPLIRWKISSTGSSFAFFASKIFSFC